MADSTSENSRFVGKIRTKVEPQKFRKNSRYAAARFAGPLTMKQKNRTIAAAFSDERYRRSFIGILLKRMKVIIKIPHEYLVTWKKYQIVWWKLRVYYHFHIFFSRNSEMIYSKVKSVMKKNLLYFKICIYMRNHLHFASCSDFRYILHN